MTLSDILAKLANVSGPNASGEFMAKCPCHDDKTASLSVTQKRSAKDGKERIFLCCHAGCGNDRVMAALGVRARDLIVNPDPAGAPKRDDAPRGRAVHTAKPVAPAGEAKQEKQEKPQIDFSRPNAVYSYTDARGRELFQVCRYEYQQDGKREKTFRQRRKAPDDPKANRDGYVMSVPNELRDNTLYRMPRVAEAIREGRTVYVVEGEKDVETLERLGMTATCNPGGAGKWRDGYTRILAGADAVILPDCDTAENGYAGQEHAWTVAMALRGAAKRVRLVDLKEACPDLPPKGDISDMAALMGDTAALDALARQAAATRDFDPESVPFWLSPMQQAEKLYAQVPGYGAANGCIVQVNGETTKALTDFIVIPRMELTRDDGVATSMFFVLDGWNSRRQQLQRVTIPAGKLDGMAWVTDSWGFSASMAPGSATRDKVAWAIKKVGQLSAKRVTEYTHTGWRKISGKWCYLYHGGAVGAEGITVDMGDRLNAFRLDGGGAEGFDAIPWSEAAAKSLSIQGMMKEEIGTALLGTVYLAPLREFLARTDIAPAFSLFLHGESGTHKSTAAALAMSHYGNFHTRNAPASFSDTANQIRRKAFMAKDAVLLVDDFHPTSSLQEKRQMAATAQALSRAFGDGADRGRLNADRTIQANTPPRCVAIITGEDLPAIGASGLARFFVLDVDKGDIPVDEAVTEMQEEARRGMLQRAMRGYVNWLRVQADGLPDRLHEMFLTYRKTVRAMSAGSHDRAPEAVAHILVGYSMMLNYMRDVGAIDPEACGPMLSQALTVLVGASGKQTRVMESEKPTRIFLDGVTELLAGKKVGLRDITAGTGPEEAKGPSPTLDMIGYMDANYYYLLPSVAFAAVQKLCREQGVEFPVSLKALYRHLRTDGVLAWTGDGENPTRNKWLDGRAVRLLWIPREKMDGPRASQEQQRMDLESKGYQDVTGSEQLPF